MFKISPMYFGSQGIHHQGALYSNGSIVSVDMDVVGVMAAYLPVVRVRVCTAQFREAHSIGSTSLHCAVHTRTRTTGKYSAITPTTSISTDTIEPLL